MNEQGHYHDVGLCYYTVHVFNFSLFKGSWYGIALSTSQICIKLTIEHNIDLQAILSYNLGPVPFLQTTADGKLSKTEKANIGIILRLASGQWLHQQTNQNGIRQSAKIIKSRLCYRCIQRKLKMFFKRKRWDIGNTFDLRFKTKGLEKWHGKLWKQNAANCKIIFAKGRNPYVQIGTQ